MPKFPKGFARRKSTANALEDQDAPVVEHSFKVFERPDGGSKSFDGGVKLAKATAGHPPVGRPKTSYREENMFEGIINGNRYVFEIVLRELGIFRGLNADCTKRQWCF